MYIFLSTFINTHVIIKTYNETSKKLRSFRMLERVLVFRLQGEGGGSMKLYLLWLQVFNHGNLQLVIRFFTDCLFFVGQLLLPFFFILSLFYVSCTLKKDQL